MYLDLLAADPQVLISFVRLLMSPPESSFPGLFHHRPQKPVGQWSFFIPDPSLGAWASWRQAAGHQAFSLVGQIHAKHYSCHDHA